MIEGKVLGGVAVAPEHSAKDIEHDIKILDGLAKKLRAARFENGTLSLESLRLEFKLDDNGHPTDCWQHTRADANDLVQEVCLPVLDVPITVPNFHPVHAAQQYVCGSAHRCSPP